MVASRTPDAVMRSHLVDVAQHGRLELIDELAHPDMVDEANRVFDGPPGVAGLRAHVAGFRRHITDVDLTIHRVVPGADEVMAWWSFTGIHRGPWLDHEATNAPVTATVFSFFDLVDGRISRYRLWLHALFSDGAVVFDSSTGRRPR